MGYLKYIQEKFFLPHLNKYSKKITKTQKAKENTSACGVKKYNSHPKQAKNVIKKSGGNKVAKILNLAIFKFIFNHNCQDS
jgi:hypothetical protein